MGAGRNLAGNISPFWGFPLPSLPHGPSVPSSYSIPHCDNKRFFSNPLPSPPLPSPPHRWGLGNPRSLANIEVWWRKGERWAFGMERVFFRQECRGEIRGEGNDGHLVGRWGVGF